LRARAWNGLNLVELSQDGIQEEILTRLAKIADLKVISRTSTQHYKTAPENLADIAKQLGVAHILEGSKWNNHFCQTKNRCGSWTPFIVRLRPDL
jgi:hypothetical protein